MSNFANLTMVWYNSPDFIDLTDRQRALLITVCQPDQALGVRHLAHALRVLKPVITRAAHSLSRREVPLLERQTDENDRRQCYLVPTEAGRAMVRAMQDLRAA